MGQLFFEVIITLLFYNNFPDNLVIAVFESNRVNTVGNRPQVDHFFEFSIYFNIPDFINS